VRRHAPRLILFDVDGTLISSGGRAGKALIAALLEAFGTAGPATGYRYSGKTDPQIVRELLEAGGVPCEHVTARMGEVLDLYLRNLRTALQPGTVMTLPGVVDLLAALRQRPDVRLGLLTGNVAPGATIKLSVAGLAEHFSVGAYGSDDADRNNLVPLARQRARERWGDDFTGERTVVVGDAEADVRCARAGGARAVAVASGWTSREQLAALAPDALLDTLAPPLSLAALLDGG
jgi:phosphoglycolate phosphatase